MLMLFKFFLALTAMAGGADLSKPLSHLSTPSSLLNEVVFVHPIEGHKINLKADNSCGEGEKVSLTSSELKCQMTKKGSNELNVFICDQQESYCKQEKLQVNVAEPKTLLGWGRYYLSGILKWEIKPKKQRSPNKALKGFLHNDVDRAILMSKKSNKPILLYYTQLYCMPCRLMKDLTLNTKGFEEVTRGFVKLQVDSDIDVSPDKMGPLNLKGTPTFVFLNSEFQKIGQSVGVLSLKDFQIWSKEQMEFLNQPLKELLAKEKKNLSDKEALRLAKWWLSQKNYEELKKLKLSRGALSDDLKDWVALSEHILSFKGEAPLSDFSLVEQKPCESSLGRAYLSSLFSAVGEMEQKPLSYKKSLERSLLSLEKHYVSKKEKMSCAIGAYYSSLLAGYFYKKQGDKAKARSYTKNKKDSLVHFKTLKEGEKLESVDIALSQLSGAKESEKKVYAKIKTENREDYSYDYWEAYDHYKKQEFDDALKACDQALLKAKGNTWQKVTVLKAKVLKASGRNPEAQKLVAKTLESLELPLNRHYRVHSFVQKLRKIQ